MHLPPFGKIESIFSKFSASSDEDWLKALIDSIDSEVLDGVRMPAFPPEEIQKGIHGHNGKISLEETYLFYKLVKNYAEFCGRTFAPSRKLLDFGSGWGRIIRFFMKDILPKNLFAAEPHGERVVTARECNPLLNFIQSEIYPPLPLLEGSLDYVVSFSVFSHLDEFVAGLWIDEFSRLLKPGGVAFLTTQGKGFIQICDQKRKRTESSGVANEGWDAALARSFLDPVETTSRYEAGDFLFSATNGTPPSLSARYGETIIPPSYVRREWGKKLHMVDFIDDPKRLPQALMVLQKPSVA